MGLIYLFTCRSSVICSWRCDGDTVDEIARFVKFKTWEIRNLFVWRPDQSVLGHWQACKNCTWETWRRATTKIATCVSVRALPIIPCNLRDGETKCHHFSQWHHSDFWVPMQSVEGSFHQQTGLKLKDETSKVLHLEHSFVLCRNLDTSESRSEISVKFWNVVLEKDADDQLDRSCGKLRSITRSQGGEEILQTIKRRNDKWDGHILRRGCLRKHPPEGMIEGCIEAKGGRRRRRNQLLDGQRGYWKLEEEALDRTLRRTCFGSGYGPVIRQTTAKWMNEWMNEW